MGPDDQAIHLISSAESGQPEDPARQGDTKTARTRSEICSLRAFDWWEIYSEDDEVVAQSARAVRECQ